MKKVVLVLVLLILATGLFAENTGEYPVSNLEWELQLFAQELELEDLYYSVRKYGDTDEYFVRYGYTMDNTTQDVSVYYLPSSDCYSVYFWDFLTFSDSQRTRVLEAVNTWNSENRNFCTLYVEDDNTVTAAGTYSLVGVEDPGAFLFDTLDWCFSILDDAYLELFLAKTGRI